MLGDLRVVGRVAFACEPLRRAARAVRGVDTLGAELGERPAHPRRRELADLVNERQQVVARACAQDLALGARDAEDQGRL